MRVARQTCIYLSSGGQSKGGRRGEAGHVWGWPLHPTVAFVPAGGEAHTCLKISWGLPPSPARLLTGSDCTGFNMEALVTPEALTCLHLFTFAAAIHHPADTRFPTPHYYYHYHYYWISCHRQNLKVTNNIKLKICNPYTLKTGRIKSKGSRVVNEKYQSLKFASKINKVLIAFFSLLLYFLSLFGSVCRWPLSLVIRL